QHYKQAGAAKAASGALVGDAYLAPNAPVSIPCGGTEPNLLYLGGEPRYTKFKSIVDGQSKTLLVGEKHVPTLAFGYLVTPSGETAYDNSIYNGDNAETVGRAAGPSRPLAAWLDEPENKNFGGPHKGICQFVFVDGSVHALAVTVDGVILGYLANR